MELDVSNQEQVDRCADEIKKLCGQSGLWALYNNAGFATAGEIEWIPMELYKRQMDVNLFGSVRVTQSILPLIRQAKGRVVTVTSGISRSSASGRSPYCMSKAALESFMECLRYEMEKFGVKCSVIQPGNLSGTTKVFAGMADQVSKIYASMPQEVKRAYGEKYLEKFSAVTVQNYSKRGGPTNAPIEPVVNDIKHAIMSEYPRIRYKPAQLGWLVWWLCHNVLPEELTHFYITKWCLRQFPKPAQVERDG
jgi:NAD(P)-dependent dehydrogenase (short-subunit alcohol dehydrogenase family)